MVCSTRAPLIRLRLAEPGREAMCLCLFSASLRLRERIFLDLPRIETHRILHLGFTHDFERTRLPCCAHPSGAGVKAAWEFPCHS